ITVISRGKVDQAADKDKVGLRVIASPGPGGERGIHGEGGDPGDFGYNGIGRMPPNAGVSGRSVDSFPKPGQSGAILFKQLEDSGRVPADLSTPPAKWGHSLVCHDLDAPTFPSKLQGIGRLSHLDMIFESARTRFMQWDAYRFAQIAATDTENVAKMQGFQSQLLSLLAFAEQIQAILPQFLPAE